MDTMTVHYAVTPPYVVTDSQLNDLEGGYNNTGKEFFFVSLGILVTLLIGMATSYNETHGLNVWYSTSSGFFFVLTLFFLFMWVRFKRTASNVIQKIKEQPLVTISPIPHASSGSGGSSANTKNYGKPQGEGYWAPFSSE